MAVFQLARGLPRTAANGNLKRPVGMHVLTLLHTQESQVWIHPFVPARWLVWIANAVPLLRGSYWTR